MDTDLDTLTAQHKGKAIRDLSDGGKVKTLDSFGYKCGPSGMNTVLINFTDGSWAYASMTEEA
jgi:hypothetical protein